MSTTTRRAVLAGTAAAVAATALPVAVFAAPSVSAPSIGAAVATDHIRRLWDEVIDLSIRLGSHETPIVHSQSGLPGWMYDRGEANALGHARYERLMEILRATPRDSEELSIIARASSHIDIENGPKTFGTARLAIASAAMTA